MRNQLNEQKAALRKVAARLLCAIEYSMRQKVFWWWRW